MCNHYFAAKKYLVITFFALVSVIIALAASTLPTSAADGLERGYVTMSHGRRMYYEAVGQGEPLLFLHGHTLDMRMWEPQVEAFSPDYRVICVDFCGYGHSSDQEEGVQFTYVDDVVTLLDSLHLDRVHLVGLSMGSFVASEMVALHSDRLLSALLASGNIRKRKGPSEPMDSLEIATRDAEIEVVRQQGIENWKHEWIEKLITGGGTQSESIRESLTQQVMDWNGWQLLHHEARLYYGYEAWDSLKARCPELPVLILSGEQEHKNKNPMLPYLPNGRQVVIPDCGHMSNMERPEEFNTLLRELLAMPRPARRSAP